MKKNTKKTLTTIAAVLIAISSLAGCGCEKSTTEGNSTADEAASVSAAEIEPTTIALDETEQAIAAQGLSVNEKGEVVDANGKKVETTANGTVKVKTENGQTVEVNADKVKETTNKTANNAAAAKQSNRSNSDNNKAAQSTSTQTSNTQTSKQNASDSGNVKPQTSSTNAKKSEDSNTSSSQTSKNTDTHAGKTYHEAVYKTVNHPAETKQVKVVDEEAYTYEEPVYEWRTIAKCKDCGIDLSQLSQEERTAHSKNHVINEGGDGGWYTAQEQVQVGTRTVEVPEKSHMETVVVKEAWTETVLVKEAAWY